VKVGLIQSNFIPWKGYFDFIDDVDLFIYHDDLQYTKGDWRNRNKIKTEKGTSWITVPVLYKNTHQLICDTNIDYSQDWISKIISKIQHNYKRSPFFDVYANDFFSIFKNKFLTISELNIHINDWIMKILGINTNIKISYDLNPVGNKTDRIIDILLKVGADRYLSGPSAINYLESDKFLNFGIALEFKSYEYMEYPQQFGKFEPNVTILDLIFNVGVNNKEYWKSLKPNVTEFQ